DGQRCVGIGVTLNAVGHETVPRHLAHDIEDGRGQALAIDRLRKRGGMGLDRAHHGRARRGPAVLLCPDRLVNSTNDGQDCHKARKPQRSARWRSAIREAVQHFLAAKLAMRADSRQAPSWGPLDANTDTMLQRPYVTGECGMRSTRRWLLGST